MATTTSSDPPGVLVQLYAWGYVPLPADHPGVCRAWDTLTANAGVRWDLLAGIAQLAGRDADDLIIVGGAAANGILEDARDTLVEAATLRERGGRNQR